MQAWNTLLLARELIWNAPEDRFRLLAREAGLNAPTDLTAPWRVRREDWPALARLASQVGADYLLVVHDWRRSEPQRINIVEHKRKELGGGWGIDYEVRGPEDRIDLAMEASLVEATTGRVVASDTWTATFDGSWVSLEKAGRALAKAIAARAQMQPDGTPAPQRELPDYAVRQVHAEARFTIPYRGPQYGRLADVFEPAVVRVERRGEFVAFRVGLYGGSETLRLTLTGIDGRGVVSCRDERGMEYPLHAPGEGTRRWIEVPAGRYAVFDLIFRIADPGARVAQLYLTVEASSGQGYTEALLKFPPVELP